MAEVFLSYGRADRPVAHAIAAELQRLGVDVWWDHDLLGGDDYRSRITETLSRATVTIVVWSRRSVESQWVIGEASLARERRTLVPLKLDGAEPPLDFRPLHAIDFTSWVPGDQLPDVLLKAVAERVGRELAYGAPADQVGALGRIARRATQSWYLNFESMIFYMIAQGFACFLCMLPFAYLANTPVVLGITGASWPPWVPYAFAILNGAILTALVLPRLLKTLRLPAALPIFALASLLGLVAYIISDVLIARLQGAVILLVGPSMLLFLLTSALGDRSVGQ